MPFDPDTSAHIVKGKPEVISDVMSPDHFIKTLGDNSWEETDPGVYSYRKYCVSIGVDGWELVFDGDRIAEGTYAAKAYAVIEEELGKRGHLQRD